MTARIRLLRGLCSTSARPRSSSSGGMYMPNRPRRPFFRPYQPPSGLSGERPTPRRCRPSPASARRRCRAPSSRRAREHRVQVVDRARVVEQRRLADHAHDHSRRRARRGTSRTPRSAAASSAATDRPCVPAPLTTRPPSKRNEPTSSSCVTTGGSSQRSRMFSWKRRRPRRGERVLLALLQATWTKLTPSSSLNVAVVEAVGLHSRELLVDVADELLVRRHLLGLDPVAHHHSSHRTLLLKTDRCLVGGDYSEPRARKPIGTIARDRDRRTDRRAGCRAVPRAWHHRHRRRRAQPGGRDLKAHALRAVRQQGRADRRRVRQPRPARVRDVHRAGRGAVGRPARAARRALRPARGDGAAAAVPRLPVLNASAELADATIPRTRSCAGTRNGCAAGSLAARAKPARPIPSSSRGS